MNPKLTVERLQRGAIVSIRQSTPGQVLHHQEGRRRQYALQDHARQLGCEQVERAGFEQLVGAVCAGTAGAIFKQILEIFSRRWPLEVCFRDVKQFLGFEDPQNRVAEAATRTAPLVFFIYDLVLLWYAQSGHCLATKSTLERLVVSPESLSVIRGHSWNVTSRYLAGKDF